MEASPSVADATSAITGAAATGSAAAAAPEQYTRFGGQPSPNSTLYIGNIFFEVNEQSLEDYFARFGTIKKTKIVYDARGLSKG